MKRHKFIKTDSPSGIWSEELVKTGRRHKRKKPRPPIPILLVPIPNWLPQKGDILALPYKPDDLHEVTRAATGWLLSHLENAPPGSLEKASKELRGVLIGLVERGKAVMEAELFSKAEMKREKAKSK